ncbi:hypothetical protein [Legionella oakridgensis]|uniref:hypothetical protein n=1 Tax=Legionella oakridgensis TaxID=29423 RepID=UPI0003DE674A|nr:hypothetical protein [Legionella oakridgensis]ETO94403.1 hypothetical protein LOR_55c11880 [Legionella oakridgensis RV-2-2007]
MKELERLSELKKALALLQQKYPNLLGKYRRWRLDSFIYHPPVQDLSEFEQQYSQHSRQANGTEENHVTDLKNKLLGAVAKNNSTKAHQYLTELFGILQTEITELADTYLFSEEAQRQLQASKNFAQFDLETKNFYRSEFALRCSVGRLYCTLNALAAGLTAVFETTQIPECLQGIDQPLNKIENGQRALVSALSKYEAMRVIIRKQIQSTNEGLIEQCWPGFEELLQQIKLKSEELTNKAKTNASYVAASKVGETLQTKLEQAAQDFFKDKKISFNTFHIRCSTAIEEARPVLKEHRGWGKVLADLAFWFTAIVTGGVVPLIHKAFTGEFRFFKPAKTDSEQKLDTFTEKLMTVAAPQFGA